VAGCGLYKSTDGGATWKHLEGHGLPEVLVERIGVSVPGGDLNRVYALIEAKEDRLYYSKDAGTTWKKINAAIASAGARGISRRSSSIRRAPKPCLSSVLDFSFPQMAKINSLCWPPRMAIIKGYGSTPSIQSIVTGNQGGLRSASVDGGNTWTTQEDHPTAQFYYVNTDYNYP
jgi:hypothetical protein